MKQPKLPEFGYNSKPVSMLSNPCGFNRCIQSKQVCLCRNACDHFHNVSNLLRAFSKSLYRLSQTVYCAVNCIHLIDTCLNGSISLQSNFRCLNGCMCDAFRIARDMMNTYGQLVYRTGTFVYTSRLFLGSDWSKRHLKIPPPSRRCHVSKE